MIQYSKSIATICLLGMGLISQTQGAPGDRKGHVMNEVIDFDKIPPAPALSPSEAMKSFQVIDGFELKQIAAEPIVQDPVSMTWDAKGDAWVVEMNSYMNDITGKDEETPTSKIVRLKDTDGDGVMDKREVMIDNVMLPRSIAFYKDGLIFADHTSLFYASYKNGVFGKRELIDPKYAENGNVEHRTNGMLLNVDNWFYNAKTNIRYKFIPLDFAVPKGAREIYRNSDFKVLREDMGLNRGQWGIARDDYGMLYYNNNSSPVITDRYIGNPVKKSAKYNFSRAYAQDRLGTTEVFPIRMNPGINRGYMNNSLTEDYKLRKMTATCGPVVYRGHQFPQKYYGMVLAAEPSANMVKATKMSREGEVGKGEFWYKDREIIASTDERFRPVHQRNAPDGSITIVDLYRGILQHRGYMTSYLERQIKSRDLDKGIHLGRLYRLSHKDGVKTKVVDLTTKSYDELVPYLAHENSWHREQAQRLLVDAQAKSVVDKIKALAMKTNNVAGQITALWTLEGMGVFDPELLSHKIQSSIPEVSITAIEIIRSAADQGMKLSDSTFLLAKARHDSAQIAVPLARSYAANNDEKNYSKILKLFVDYPSHKFLPVVVMSAFHGQDDAFTSYLEQSDNGQAFLKKLKPYMPKKAKKAPKLSKSEQELFGHGKKLYLGAAACFGCHGQEGQGMPMMGPPLDGSEWVTGSPARLTGIMLHGLTGPIKVAGKKYTTPMVMPGLKDHAQIKDKDLSAIATYIRNAWSNRSKAITEKSFSSYRAKYKDRATPYTEKELLKLK